MPQAAVWQGVFGIYGKKSSIPKNNILPEAKRNPKNLDRSAGTTVEGGKGVLLLEADFGGRAGTAKMQDMGSPLSKEVQYCSANL